LVSLGFAATGSGGSGGSGTVFAFDKTGASFFDALGTKSGGSGASSGLTDGLEPDVGEHSDPEDEEVK
jgi:hypothetical protein